MIEKEFQIRNKLGLHARAAALFVKLTNKFKSKVMVIKNSQEVNGKSILGLLTLGITSGTSIKIIADGEDEKELIDALTDLIEKDNFHEE